MDVGDKVKISIDDPDDPDYKYDGQKGEIIDISEDDPGGLTGDPKDDLMYEIELENGEVPGIHFRHNDLIPYEQV